MMANSLQDWLKRYWLWMLLIGAFVIYALTLLLPGGKGKESVLAETKEKVTKLKEEREVEHKKIAEEMDAKIKELTEIKSIPDEATRLQKLADFANRYKRK